MNFKTNYILILIIAVLGFANEIFAQQDAQYTQYMYNPMNVNPAYAGTRDVLSIFGMHRTQWVGLDGAPVTNTFSLHSPIKEGKYGIGISVMSDKIGPIDESSLSIDYAYKLNLSNSILSFGLKGHFNLLNIDYSKLDIYDTSDNQFMNDVENKFSPNIGAGLYWYSDQYYVGLSVPRILETKYYNNTNFSSTARERMHYYIMGGYVFDLNNNIKFKPAILSKIVSGAPVQLDLTANFMFYDKFIIGGAYRLDAAYSLMAGFQVSNKILIGYAYDKEISKLSNFNSGSHEIFLRFELFENSTNVFNPRFF
ncbi:membrane protein [Flavobacterium ammoniigenes]|uniref:Membrane protein n=1 Tax=Flavobacterium ammoniigenes TaxID=1751095 RepID=A0ABN6KXC1_9FLAO|nr:type IX secretion system membrane protein PorP/SprF [Flavobacterium ammoniigenes]BDB53824.1 membrane protein [Flavobacterium ammoniigenes]